MISAQLLKKIHERLQQITGNFQDSFGGLDVIFIGDLRQLPPVRATPIYLPTKSLVGGPILWRGLKLYELNQVMRQANVQFASILTKIGNGDVLEDDERAIIESRFFTKAEVDARCPGVIRIFNTNQSVNEYNHQILISAEEKVVSTARDTYIGCSSDNQTALMRQKVHKMSLIDTGGLPYETIFVMGILYLLTTNIDVADGLANGAVGKWVHLDRNDAGEVTVVWLDFPDNSNIGIK